jgi:predicted lysophospholipase L1 biosynthesis ABC-type transport system permease subunit
VAVGVAAVGAVHGLAAELRSKVRGDAREWIAADLYVNLADLPSDEAMDALQPLFRSGAKASLATELYGLAGSDETPDPALTFVKVVDPEQYPFFGVVTLWPPQALRQALAGNSVVASQDLLDALKLHTGDTLRLGKARFHVAGAIVVEPDWSAGLSTALPRILLSAENFAYTGIAPQGDVEHKLLVRLNGANLLRARRLLEQTFPEGAVVDYRDPDPAAAAAFDQAASYFTVAAWMALAVGALAQALILHLHIQSRLDSVGVMKALAARGSQVLAIYGLQAALLALAGGVLGAIAALPVEDGLARLAERFLHLNLTAGWNWIYAAEAVGAGLATAIPAAAAPILRLRHVSPLAVFRRHTAARPPRRIVAARFLPLAGRLAVRNLFSPGNHAVAMVASLSAGIAMLSATYLCQQRISQQLAHAAPTEGANLYVVSAGRSQLDAATAWLAAQPGVEGTPIIFPLVDLRLNRINDIPFAAGSASLPETWLATCSGAASNHEILLPRASPLRVNPGDRLEFSFKGQSVNGQVSRRRIDYLEGLLPALTFPCAAFAGLPVFYHAAVSVKPGEEVALRRALAARFPGLPTISRTEFIAMVNRVSGTAILMMRLMSFSMLAVGVMLQALLVAAGKNLRLAEVAIFRALGARPRLVTRLFLVEFGSIGFAAGVVGSLLGALLASLVLSALLHRSTLVFDVRIALVGAALSMITAASAGTLASRTILRQKPFEILRQE